MNNSSQFKKNDLSNQVFGKLIALEILTEKKNGCYYWMCKCECGNIKKVLSTRLVQGVTKSCGCLKYIKGQNKTHGLRNHPLYSIWKGMKYRCYNEKCKNYKDYGGRDIKMCDEWYNSMENFYNDMVIGYIKGEVELDRINVNGNYCKENCRWVTQTQNANNKRNNKYISMNGIVRTAAEWGRLLGIKDNTITNRLKRGLSVEKSLSRIGIKNI